MCIVLISSKFKNYYLQFVTTIIFRYKDDSIQIFELQLI